MQYQYWKNLAGILRLIYLFVQSAHHLLHKLNLGDMVCTRIALFDLYTYLLRRVYKLFDLLRNKYLLRRVCSQCQSMNILLGILDSLYQY